MISENSGFSFHRVLMVGDVGGDSSFHVGDEAMLECNLLLLRRLLPAAIITLVSNEPLAVQRRYDCPSVMMPRLTDVSTDREAEMQLIDAWMNSLKHDPDTLPEALHALLTADLLVISGGGNLCSSWPGLILERLALVRMARARNIPVLIFGQTIGPVLLDHDRPLVTEILCSADSVGLREANSVALTLSLGVPLSRIVYQFDDAMLLPPVPCPLLWPDFRAGPLLALTLHPVFAIATTEIWLDHLASELDQVIQETSAHVLFIPHLRMIQDGCDLGDLSVGKALASRLKNPQAMTVLDVRSSAETLWLTQQADVVVSTRYHPLVFGLAKQIPCLGLATDHYTLVKLHGALSHANCEADLLPMCGQRWDGLAERIMQLCQRPRVSAEQARTWHAELEKAARAREERLKVLLAREANSLSLLPVQLSELTELVRDLAKVALCPSLFSLSAAREYELQRSIAHWQATARAAELYALDLKLNLQAKESELLALHIALREKFEDLKA